jgi:hypothetical protein
MRSNLFLLCAGFSCTAATSTLYHSWQHLLKNVVFQQVVSLPATEINNNISNLTTMIFHLVNQHNAATISDTFFFSTVFSILLFCHHGEVHQRLQRRRREITRTSEGTEAAFQILVCHQQTSKTSPFSIPQLYYISLKAHLFC